MADMLAGFCTEGGSPRCYVVQRRMGIQERAVCGGCYAGGNQVECRLGEGDRAPHLECGRHAEEDKQFLCRCGLLSETACLSQVVGRQAHLPALRRRGFLCRGLCQRLSGGDAQGGLFGFRLRNRRTGQVW